MASEPTVFLSEYVSEDTNPWDGRERFGIYTTFESAVLSLKWLTEDYARDGQDFGWAQSDTYGGSLYGRLVKNCWKWSERNDEGEFEDDGEGYGVYIWEEYLDSPVHK